MKILNEVIRTFYLAEEIEFLEAHAAIISKACIGYTQLKRSYEGARSKAAREAMQPQREAYCQLMDTNEPMASQHRLKGINSTLQNLKKDFDSSFSGFTSQFNKLSVAQLDELNNELALENLNPSILANNLNSLNTFHRHV